MTRLLLIALALLISFNSSAQNLSEIASSKNGTDWIKLKSHIDVAPDEFFDEFQSNLGFNNSYSFVLQKQFDDDLGFEHYKFNQYFNNVRIEGSQYILHSKSDRVIKANGKLVANITCNTVPTVNPKQAIESCKNYVNAARYYWEDPQMEAMIKKIKNDPEASFYPIPELVIADPLFSQNGNNYSLCWKVDVYAERAMDHEILYVDAVNGGILFTEDGCVTGSGTAVTRYDGNQTICTHKVSDSLYTLVDSTRGGGVFTYDLNESLDITTFVDFEDDDNYWDNANAEFDDAATDCHWGMEMTYDYFKQKHNRLSFDDNDGAIISYVHVNMNWFNATWNGMYARFGDGNGNPLTSIDVAAHELTHGVTDYTSDLVYMNESGALNESFSDIFGSAVKNFGLGIDNNWDIGTANFLLRRISNPKSFGDPDTYFGQFWATGPGDNGGVHTNSGVQNYWYYLLSVGGLDTNDVGDAYNVVGLGRDTAEAIAYRNTFAYLTRTSNYFDARQGAIEAAEDLYGSCSFEVIQTAKAWYAVGVGPDTVTTDFQLLSMNGLMDGCDLGTSESISITYKFNESGCGDDIASGSMISFGYNINGGSPVIETMMFPNTVIGGDTLNYTFSQTADLSVGGTYLIDVWINYSDDEFAENDTILEIELKKPIVLGFTDTIRFEERIEAYDSLYIEDALRSQTLIQHRAAAHGSDWGMQMGGINYQQNNVTIPSTEADNFVLNPDYAGKFCFCVDATGWSNARLVFDLKQTYSRIYKDVRGLGDIPELVSSMRIVVDGIPVGTQYHPTTNDSDLFVTQVVNLDQFAGSAFEACFEGKHFIRWQEDNLINSQGDHTFVDNVYFTDQALVGIDEVVDHDFGIYPNPNDGQFFIQLNESIKGDLMIEVIDVTGRSVYERLWSATNSGATINFDLSGLSKGIYMITLNHSNTRSVRRLIIE